MTIATTPSMTMDTPSTQKEQDCTVSKSDMSRSPQSSGGGRTLALTEAATGSIGGGGREVKAASPPRSSDGGGGMMGRRSAEFCGSSKAGGTEEEYEAMILVLYISVSGVLLRFRLRLPRVNCKTEECLVSILAEKAFCLRLLASAIVSQITDSCTLLHFNSKNSSTAPFWRKSFSSSHSPFSRGAEYKLLSSSGVRGVKWPQIKREGEGGNGWL